MGIREDNDSAKRNQTHAPAPLRRQRLWPTAVRYSFGGKRADKTTATHRLRLKIVEAK